MDIDDINKVADKIVWKALTLPKMPAISRRCGLDKAFAHFAQSSHRARHIRTRMASGTKGSGANMSTMAEDEMKTISLSRYVTNVHHNSVENGLVIHIAHVCTGRRQNVSRHTGNGRKSMTVSTS